MLKLIGSVMVFGSCAALGLSARQNLRRRVAAADAMLLALGLIRSEISGRRTPMPEIVGLLTENEQPIIRKVFRTLQRRLREQNGLSLGYLWRSTLRDCRAQVGLGTQECDILCDAANYLGRYDADEQLTGLSQVERRLAASREAAQEDLANRGNLYRTCGIALGLLVILVLAGALGVGIVRIYGSRLPELRSKSQALDAQIQQVEKQNEALRSDLEHQGDQDFIQGLARDDLGLASDGERIFYDVNN